MARKRTLFDDSLRKNNWTFNQYYKRLTELSVSMFEWENLPDTVDPRFLEMALFRDGKAVFFKDDATQEFYCLYCIANGPFNIYNIPVNRVAYATNGYRNSDLTEKNSVIIYNNYLRTNSVLDVQMFSERLYNLDRAIDVNANAQKTPVMIQCDEAQRLTMLNLYQKYDGNEPFIFGDKNLDIKALKVLNTGAPYVADKLYQLKTQYWNEALTYLGISNVSFQKKERMVSDEVTRSMGSTIASRYSRLMARREACDKINRMFGLNIECNYRQDYREVDDEFMLPGDTSDNTTDTMATDVKTEGGAGNV